LRLAELSGNGYMEVVRLSTLRTGPLYHKEILISVGDRVDPRAIMRLEEKSN
jgi:hypothetical protein